MTLQELKALKVKRRELIEQARSVLNLAQAEKRSITEDERAKYDAIDKDIDALTDEIEREEKLRDQERSLAESTAHTAEVDNASSESTNEQRAAILVAAARSFIATGKVEADHYNEWRALQAGSDTEGGFLVMPEMFVNQLIKFVDDIVTVRGLSTVFQVANATSLGVPSLDTDIDDSDWTTELQTGSEDSSMAFGKRALTPHPFAKRIKVSNDLLANAAMSVEQIVLQRLGYKFALTEEKGFLTGNGSGQPLGLFTANANGISTGRDVSTDNTTTAITFDGLKNAKYNLKAQYQNSPSTVWMFHRDGVKQIDKLKDGNDQYIWQPSVVVGAPDRLLNVPVVQSEWVPNTFTTGQYVGIIGDMKNYWIVDALDLQIKRLDELYAETNQVGFIGRKSSDGMPVLEEAFTRVTLD